MECGPKLKGVAELDTIEVVYVLLRFPYLTETFVADEIWELQQHGTRVRIFSLLEPKDDPVQPISKRLAKDTRYAPGLLTWRLWWAQLYFVVTSPFKYVTLLICLLKQPYLGGFRTHFPRRLLIFLKAVALARTLKDSPISLIHAHFAWLSGAAARVMSDLLGIPYTVTVHAYDIYSSNDLLCFTARSAARVIAISEYNRQMMLKKCTDLEGDSISVIHCGISLDLFTPRPQQKLDGRPLSILSIGSLIEKKGHEHLIQACRELKVRGEDFRCTIIGRGPKEDSLRQLVRDCGLEDRVVLAGACKRDAVLDAYRGSDLFVLACVVAKSGDRDGIPVVLMEALAMQIPSISTQVSGIPELVRHKETGWLVPERDATAIADAIVNLANDDKLRAELAKNGRALVEKEFEIKGNVGRLMEVFRQVVGEARPQRSSDAAKSDVHAAKEMLR